jgi:Glycosyltransferase 61
MRFQISIRRLINSFFRRTRLGPSSCYAREYSSTFPFSKIPVHGLESLIAEQMRWYATRPQESYFFDYNRTAMTDPQFGWLIQRHQVIVESVPFGVRHGLPNPSLSAYYFKKKQITPFAMAASIRYGWENYWHFFNDSLCQLCMLDDFGIPPDTPIVVPDFVQRTPYIHEAFKKTPWLAQRRWVYQDQKTWVKARRWAFCKNRANNLQYLDRILDQLGVPKATSQPGPKVFISRRTATSRRIKNEQQIGEIAQRAGLTVLNTETMTLDQQITTFSRAEVVVGPHGAGLTNILFRRSGNLRLLEISPKNLIAPHYFWLAKLYGHDYASMLGGEVIDGEFVVDPKVFEHRLDTVISGRSLT